MRYTLPMAAAIALSCLMASTAMAQTAPEGDTVAPPAPVESSVPASAPATIAAAVVPKGTLIAVEITDLVTTRTAQPKDIFNLKLVEPVMLNGTVVIPAGTPGKGEVVDAGKPGMAGKPGKLVLAGRYLEFEGQQIPIRSLKMTMGARDNSGTAVAVGMAVGIFGLAVTGGHMEVQVGTRASAKLGADFVPGAATPTAAPPATEPTADPSAPSTDTPADPSAAPQAQ